MRSSLEIKSNAFSPISTPMLIQMAGRICKSCGLEFEPETDEEICKVCRSQEAYQEYILKEAGIHDQYGTAIGNPRMVQSVRELQTPLPTMGFVPRSVRELQTRRSTMGFVPRSVRELQTPQPTMGFVPRSVRELQTRRSTMGFVPGSVPMLTSQTEREPAPPQTAKPWLPEAQSEEEKAETTRLLRELDAWKRDSPIEQPLSREIRGLAPIPSQVHIPSPAFLSTQISKSNQDCVLAAFATIIGNKMWTVRFETVMTSTDSGIQTIAVSLGFGNHSRSDLLSHLTRGGKAFIRAPALYGNGWHAYCAFGLMENNYILAYDPDADEQTRVKKIPIEKIDETFIFY